MEGCERLLFPTFAKRRRMWGNTDYFLLVRVHPGAGASPCTALRAGSLTSLRRKLGGMVASDFGAVAFLGDLDRIEDGFHVGIAGTGRGIGLNAAEEREKGRGLVGEIAGGLFALGVEVGAGVDGGQHAQ